MTTDDLAVGLIVLGYVFVTVGIFQQIKVSANKPMHVTAAILTGAAMLILGGLFLQLYLFGDAQDSQLTIGYLDATNPHLLFNELTILIGLTLFGIATYLKSKAQAVSFKVCIWFMYLGGVRAPYFQQSPTCFFALCFLPNNGASIKLPPTNAGL